MADTKAARVFLAHETPRFDTTPAEQFGEVVPLLGFREFSPTNVDRIVSALLDKLDRAEFDAARDRVALTGSSVFVTVLVAILLWRHRTVRLLIWSPGAPGEGGEYYERFLTALGPSADGRP